MANPRPTRPFQKDDTRINRRGRPAGQMPAKAIVWDLKMAARSYCKEALQFIVETMRDQNESRDTRMKAATILLERGYGRPEVTAEVDVNQRFAYAIVPEVLSREEWLETVAKPALEERASEAPPGVADYSKGAPPILDLKANEERPEPELPPGPAIDPAKLN
jgi:hypothetical protein